MARIKINVSGTHFEFDRKILDTRENHTLTNMCNKAVNTDNPLELFADRPADCFAAILSYYQTGELHMPATVCPKAFKKELNYWGIAETDLDKCCLYKYYTFFDDFETHEKFSKETFTHELMDGMFLPTYKGNKLNRLRCKIWKVVDFKENTVCAKRIAMLFGAVTSITVANDVIYCDVLTIYLTLVFMMVMLCIITLAFSTVPTFWRRLSKCEMLEYLDHSQHNYLEKARIKFGNPDCSGFVHNDINDLEDDDLYWEDEMENNMGGNLTTSKTNVTLPLKKVRLFVFEVLEIISAAFFTTDLLLRLFTCPSLIRFVRSIVNIFDMLAVIGFYVHVVVISIEKEHRYTIGWIRLIGYLQIFRVMRLFRIVKNVRASRVLSFSLRKNGSDLTLLVLLLMIGVSTSACLIYFIEDRDVIESIPVAWYWAMITLTTVGYGDIAPKSSAGRTVSALLSICGVLLLAITLPMFVNNFLTLYQYSCLDETIEERTKFKRKLEGSSATTNVANGKTSHNAVKTLNNENKNDGLHTLIVSVGNVDATLENDKSNH